MDYDPDRDGWPAPCRSFAITRKYRREGIVVDGVRYSSPAFRCVVSAADAGAISVFLKPCDRSIVCVHLARLDLVLVLPAVDVQRLRRERSGPKRPGAVA